MKYNALLVHDNLFVGYGLLLSTLSYKLLNKN